MKAPENPVGDFVNRLEAETESRVNLPFFIAVVFVGAAGIYYAVS